MCPSLAINFGKSLQCCLLLVFNRFDVFHEVTLPRSKVCTRNPRKPPLGCKLVVAKRELLRFLLQIEEEVPVWLWSLALCALEPAAAAAAACLLLLLGCLWCFALSIDSFDFLNARRFMGNWHGFWDCIDFCGLV